MVNGEGLIVVKRRNRAEAETLQNLVLMAMIGIVGQQRCSKRTVENQTGIALNLLAIFAVIMDAMAVEREGGVAEQLYRRGG